MINQMASKYHINNWRLYDKPNAYDPNTILITGDSMINQMASKYHIKMASKYHINNWRLYDKPNGLQIPY